MGFFRDRRRRPNGTGDRVVGARGDTDVSADPGHGVERLLSEELGAVTIADTEPSRAPSPLTRARVLEWIAENDYSYFIDSDGDIGGIWNSRLFYFLSFGTESEILQIRGQWNREVTIERVREVLEFCNEWNTQRIWPKAYFRVRDNGLLQVYGEVSVDFEHGVNADQLDRTLTCGLSTAAMLFDALDARYPDPARVTP